MSDKPGGVAPAETHTATGTLNRYGVAVLAAGAAVLAKRILLPHTPYGAFSMLWPAIVFSAWYGGFWPGMVTTILSTGLVYQFFTPVDPRHSIGVAIVWGCSLLGGGALISAILAAMRRRTDELAEANRTLQEEVTARAEMERALQREVDLSTQLVKNSPDGIVAFDRECRYWIWNPAMERITGLAQHDILGKRAFDAFPFIEATGVDRLFSDTLAGHSTVAIDRPYEIPGTGHAGFYEGYSAPLRNAAGEVVGGVAIVRDVTERMRAERALLRSNQTLKAVFDASPLGIVFLAADGTVQLWNAAAERMFGWTPDEVLGHVLPIVPEHQEETFRALLQRELAGHPQTGLELHRRRKDGTEIDVSLWTAAVHTTDAAADGVIGVFADVTERRRAEAEIRELNQRLSGLLERISDAFVAVDAEQRVTYVNAAAERLMHRTSADLMGKAIWPEFQEAVGSPLHRLFQQVIADRVPVVTEDYWPPINRWLTIRIYPSGDGTSALIEDSTERHTVEVTALSDILRALNSHLDVADAFQTVASGIHTITECDFSYLALLDDTNEWISFIALGSAPANAVANLRMRATDMAATAHVLAGQPYMVADLTPVRDFAAARAAYAQGFRSVLNVPLRGTQRIIGMLGLLWRRQGGPTDAQVPVVRQVADALALAVDKKRLFEEVDAARQRLGVLSRRLIEIQELERRHLARELHDEVGQELTAIKLGLDTLERVPPATAQTRLHEAQNLVAELLGRVRDLSLDLRPAILDDFGLIPALLWLSDRYTRQTGVEVQLEHRGVDGRRFAAEIETGAYRIVQEALTNVARHAGVQQAGVRVWVDDGHLTLQVFDQGKGFAVSAEPGTTGGVLGMQERAHLLGGDLRVDSTPGHGTQVTAHLPALAPLAAPSPPVSPHAAAGGPGGA